MQAVWLQIFIIKKLPNEKAPCKCLSIIMLDSVIKANKKVLSSLLKECKHVQEKVKTENHIDDDLGRSESESDSNDKTESDMIMVNKFNAIKAYTFWTHSVLIMHY